MEIKPFIESIAFPKLGEWFRAATGSQCLMTNLDNIALYLLPMFAFLLGIIAFFKSLLSIVQPF